MTDRVAYGITPTTMEITPGTESDCENIRQPTTGGGHSGPERSANPKGTNSLSAMDTEGSAVIGSKQSQPPQGAS